MCVCVCVCVRVCERERERECVRERECERERETEREEGRKEVVSNCPIQEGNIQSGWTPRIREFMRERRREV